MCHDSRRGSIVASGSHRRAPQATCHKPQATIGVRPRGFTLLEMVVVIGILGILFGLLLVPLVSSFHFLGNETSEIALQNTTRDAVRVITSQIASASQVTTYPDNPMRIDLVLPATSALNQQASLVGSGGAPGNIRETFFVAQADPFDSIGPAPNPAPPMWPHKPYNAPGAWTQTNGRQLNLSQMEENEYVLWRAVYNLNDPNDPVTQAMTTDPLSDPWFFDDSLEGKLDGAAHSPLGATAPGTALYPSPRCQTLLAAMRNYTVKLANGTPVAAQLTPVVMTGHLDAVSATWNDPAQGWVFNPLVNFVAQASRNEQMTPQQFGTQFTAQGGQWVTTGASAYTLGVYWGPWQLNQTANLDGTVYPITFLDGSGSVLSGPGTGPVYTIDPILGKVTFNQYEVTETIPVASGPGGTTQTVYPLSLPFGQVNGNDTNTYASAPLAPAGTRLRPQIVPFTDTLQVVTTPATGAPATLEYRRQEANYIATDPHTGSTGTASQADDADQASQGLSAQAPGVYDINYAANPNIGALLPPTSSAQPYISAEIPLIEVPPQSVDSNMVPWNGTTGTRLEVTYRFTFATLGADGNPLVSVGVNYSSQAFIDATVGFRKFRENISTPLQFSLSTSVAAGNRVDAPNGG